MKKRKNNYGIFTKRIDFFSGRRISYYVKNNLFSLVIVLLLAVFLFGLTFYFYFPKNLNLKVGEVAPENITAPRTFTYVDSQKTAELKKKIAESVSPVYKLDVNKEKEVLKKCDDIFNKIDSILSSKKDVVEKHKELEALFSGNKSFADLLLKESTNNIEKMREFTKAVLYKLMIMGVKSDSINQAVQIGTEEINKSPYSDAEKELMAYVLRQVIEPNLIYDKEATESAIQKAVNAVPPVKVTINKGDIIVQKGEKITQDEYNILVAIGLVRTKSDWKIILSIIIFILYFLGISYAGLLDSKKIRESNKAKKSAEFAIISAIVFIMFFLLEPISPYLIPVPLLAFLIFAFFDKDAAIITSVAFMLLITLPFDIKPAILFAMLASTVISLFILRHFSRMVTIIYAGLAGAVSFTILTLLIDITGNVPLLRIEFDLTYAFVNFFGSSLFALGIIFVLDHIFNETTTVRLLELSDTNTPLLKELLLKAPGTYQHSMNVASLASAAVSAIGGNALLVRVGAYYHDIGKMLHPYYFTENQMGIPNIHNEITPNLSKTVIINHVKDGVQIAKRYRLPEEVINFIRTHHGTTVVSYFYHKAKEKDPNVRKDDFRYPGPLPHTKEEGVLMLADAVEAKMHSMVDLDKTKISEVVESIVNDRIEDGQLDECALTLADLKKVKESLFNSMVSFYHRREAYPEEKNDKS